MNADRRHARRALSGWPRLRLRRDRLTLRPAPRAAAWQRLAWAMSMGTALAMLALGASAGKNAACAAASPDPGDPAGVLSLFARGCSLSGAVRGDLVAAVSPVEYAGSAACGAYLDVTGPRGTVRVQVIDECRSCAAGELDLSRAAFARIAGPDRGVVPVRYHRVRNPAVPRPVAFRLKKGSSPRWLAIQAVDHGNPLRRLQILHEGHWRDLSREYDNYWVADRGAGSGPYTVRITDVYGQRLVASGIHLVPEGIQRTTRRLYVPAAASPAPPAGAAQRTTGNAPPRAGGQDTAAPWSPPSGSGAGGHARPGRSGDTPSSGTAPGATASPGSRPESPASEGTASGAAFGGTASGGEEYGRAGAGGSGPESSVPEGGAARGTLDVDSGAQGSTSGRAPLAALPSTRPFFC
ncbi:expansin EXLX1 family cellulose-binding protein [Sphaerisporangium perillae]|uniref:expansin EXLX1 family cellulose-binding protein n=1 Tax=Sphaerisporangium perillae TaxID=2935860 RepID=UPI00200D0F1D|nr:expansin EXLX1 family cellulose-binding protein [Sphaerisporangium perillae]